MPDLVERDREAPGRRRRDRALGAIAVLVSACASCRAHEALQPTSEARSDGELTLTSRVTAVLGERVFTVVSEDGDPAAQPTLVLAPRRVVIKRSDPVRMRGSLRPFVVNEVERDLGIDLDPAIEGAFEGRQVFVAEAIEVLHPLPPTKELEDDDPL